MPPIKRLVPLSLENLSLQAYINLLKNETEILFHLRAYSPKSMLMGKVCPQDLVRKLENQFSSGLHGILQDIVRQKIVDHMIENFHTLMDDCISITSIRGCKSYQILLEQSTNKDFCSRPSPTTSSFTSEEAGQSSSGRYSLNTLRYLPFFQQLSIILSDEVQVLDFSKNKDIYENEEVTEICRVLWKIVGEKCRSLQKLILTKDLTYSSTLNSVIVNGSQLTQLTLKRNVPNNIFLNLIGQHCPKIQELDVAGSEIINDFGIVCLLFSDPEQIFLKCWNRDKTVGGQVRRSLRVFPQPYYDRQIPDQQEPSYSRSSKSGSGNYLYLKKTFHEALRSGECGDWERLQIATSLRKLRLENTKVKGDGASVVLESCPNIYSLGYLVFAAAGLKQVFGYEEEAVTNLTETFYRGPSDQKLLTIANCCPNLKTLFLGSNNPRALHHKIFKNWKSLSYLTLENIVVESVISCLEVVGHQIKGLKLQCTDLNLPDIAALCPKLNSLIIQKESPQPVIKLTRPNRGELFGALEHLEVASQQFSKACFEFVISHAVRIVTLKVLCIPKLMKSDLETWFSNHPLNYLKSLVILKGPTMSLDSTLYILRELPSLTEIGISDLNSGDVYKSIEFKKLQSEIKKREWDLNLIDFGGNGSESEERDFSKLQNLHWFYLTPNDTKRWEVNSENSKSKLGSQINLYRV